MIATAVLAFGVIHLSQTGGQATPEVQMSTTGSHARLAHHLILLAFLLAATRTDLMCYLIPDEITLPGTLLAFGMAMGFQELQLTHLWVDWHEEIPGLRGPYIPEWISGTPWWHSLAWPTAGLVAGAGLIYFMRLAAFRILGVEAMGFGDVTLMGMVGAFIGWQAVVCAILLAPAFGILHAIAAAFRSERVMIPFGPSLAAGSWTVVVFWGPIWKSSRTIFGDWVSLVILAGVAVVGLVVALMLLSVRKKAVAETKPVARKKGPSRRKEK